MTQPRMTSMLRSSAARVEVGASPGTLFPNPTASPTALGLVGYGPDRIETQRGGDAAAVRAFAQRHRVTWVAIDGLADTGLIQTLAAEFGVHGLAVADVVNLHQRPKVEEYEDHLFIVLRAPVPGDGLKTQQVCLVLGVDYVLTFAEQPSELLAPVASRLQRDHSVLRAHGADFLAYSLLDAVIDAFFPLIESYGEMLELVETRTIERPEQDTSRTIHSLRADLLLLRRSVWPLRELVNELSRGTSTLISDATRVYLRDCYDHAVHLIDTVETYRELAFGLVDLYMSSLSARMSEVMKVLTIIATMFIPLTFIAGVYGMNFDRRFPANMPELGWSFGYPFSLALMAAAAAGMIGYFRRKGWIGLKRDDEA